MNCLHCGKPISTKGTALELSSSWHAACVKRFFGTASFPTIELTQEVFQELADDNVKKGYTIPGVQRKLSLHLTKGKNARLTLFNQLPGYILKPQNRTYQNLPEAEFLAMQMANASGIKTVPFGLVKISSGEETLAFITKRIDRIFPNRNNSDPKFLSMEDFCQLDGRPTADKYRGSYERCAKIISKYSDRPGLDHTELFLLMIFSYVIGNSDLHLKNLSLIETEPMRSVYVLSAAYDLLPVSVFFPDDLDEMALTIIGKKRNLVRNDFIHYGEAIGIEKETAIRLIEKIVSMKEAYLQMCQKSYLSPEIKDKFSQLIEKRCEVLS